MFTCVDLARLDAIITPKTPAIFFDEKKEKELVALAGQEDKMQFSADLTETGLVDLLCKKRALNPNLDKNVLYDRVLEHWLFAPLSAHLNAKAQRYARKIQLKANTWLTTSHIEPYINLIIKKRNQVRGIELETKHLDTAGYYCHLKQKVIDNECIVMDAHFERNLQRDLRTGPPYRRIQRYMATSGNTIATLKRFTFIVNHGGNHWVAVGVELDEKRVIVYDSLLQGIYKGRENIPSSHQPHFDIALKYVEIEASQTEGAEHLQNATTEFEYELDGSVKQENDYDCGCFSLLTMLALAFDCKRAFTQQDIPAFRLRLAWEIHHKNLLF
jgi:hypothetical protein